MVIDRTEAVRAEMHRRGVRAVNIARLQGVRLAQELAPVDQGDLKKKIHGTKVEDSGGKISCKIISPVEYAEAQELGPKPGSKRKFRFTPYMRPMIDHMQKVFRGIAEKTILGE